jgi:hypothetical protein
MTREEELLLEEVTTAHRERRADGSVKSHPAWHDLDEAGKREAFEATVLVRKLEAAIDVEGQSSTVHAVLRRITGR